MKNNKFIHFGCWNKGLCQIKDNLNLNLTNNSTPNNPISRVMNKLQYHQNVDFIAVAGDNFYPEKKQSDKGKVKIIHPTDMASGFECLPNGVPIYMILGNHDLETNTHTQSIFIENEQTPEEFGSCFMLKEEVKLSEKHDPPIEFVLNKSVLFERTLILMLDTSMYDCEESDETINGFLPCYQTLLQNPNLTKQELYQLQQDFVLNTIKQNQNQQIKNLVIIGHHPITGYKFKKNKVNLIEPFPSFVQLWSLIHSNTLNKETIYYYLCADLHLYQIGNVVIHNNNNNNNEMLIHQYIVGTGGADLDDHPYFDNYDNDNKNYPTLQNYENYSVQYTMNVDQIEHSLSAYGFLECIESEKNGLLQFQFYNVDNDSIVVEEQFKTLVGGLKKKRKSKTKRRTRKSKTKRRMRKTKTKRIN
jgi:hypothetical protein